jgi:hypothetical protein
MFHARIISPRGSLYFAAELTPYDLENLRSHVQELQSPSADDVRLELTLDEQRDANDRHVSALLRRLSADGIQVSIANPHGQPMRSPMRQPMRMGRARRETARPA